MFPIFIEVTVLAETVKNTGQQAVYQPTKRRVNMSLCDGFNGKFIGDREFTLMSFPGYLLDVKEKPDAIDRLTRDAIRLLAWQMQGDEPRHPDIFP